MNSNNGSDMRVGIITDAQNTASWEFLDAVFRLKTQAGDPEFPRYHRDTTAAHISDLSTEEDRRILAGKLNHGEQIMVVSLGVPGRPDDYRAKVHTFLDTWRESPRKPVLLFVSENPDLTQQIVDAWPGWGT